MALLDNQTKLNQGTSFFAAAGSGGGSANLTVSSLTAGTATISTIQSGAAPMLLDGQGQPISVAASAFNIPGALTTISSLNVSSINGAASVSGVLSGVSTISGPGAGAPVNIGPAGAYIFTNGFADGNSGFEVYQGGGNTTVAQADFDAGALGSAAIGLRGYSTIGGNQVIDSLFTVRTDTSRNGIIALTHEFNGLSTMGYLIMGQNGNLQLGALETAAGGANTNILLDGYSSTIVFGPQLAVACHSSVPVSTNSTVPQAGTTQNLGAWTSIVGHAYDVRLPVRIDAVGTPNAGDWAAVGTDTATANVSLGTFDMTQVNSIGNQWETHLCGTVIASGATTTLTAIGRLNAGASTAVTVTGSAAFIRDLGIPVPQ